jgi:sirohydrochlorin cobaltochelatase
MTLPLTPAAEGGVQTEVLLLVSGEADAAQQQLAARLGGHHLQLGNNRHARAGLAAALAGRPYRVVAVPLTLTAQDPLLADLAGLLRWAARRWPAVTFLQGAPFASPEHLVGWASRQAQAALESAPEPVENHEAAVLLVAPGSSAEANAAVSAVARLLWENRDYRRVDTAFSGSGQRPGVTTSLRDLSALGVKRTAVVPLAFSDGPFLSEVRAQALSGSAAVCAGPLLTPAAAAAVIRQRHEDALARWFRTGDDGLTSGHEHDHGLTDPLEQQGDLLPPRYQGGQEVDSAPMRSAGLKYDADGQVAWNEIWQSFCNLALAGGPPHRGKLLEPPLREEVLADPAGYERVVAEIARGLTLITRLPVVTDASPGWVGLVCPGEEMAIWMLRAIVVENVSVRREGNTLFLPAGPAYRVDREIKNVITSVAKTHHYWTEHRAAR